MSEKCPRSKIVRYEKRYDNYNGYYTFTLNLSCGHTFEQTHKEKDWNPPKTTFCGACWREKAINEA